MWENEMFEKLNNLAYTETEFKYFKTETGSYCVATLYYIL